MIIMNIPFLSFIGGFMNNEENNLQKALKEIICTTRKLEEFSHYDGHTIPLNKRKMATRQGNMP